MIQSWSLGAVGFPGKFVKIDPESAEYKEFMQHVDYPIVRLVNFYVREAYRQNVLTEIEAKDIIMNILDGFIWTAHFRTARDYLFDLEKERQANKIG